MFDSLEDRMKAEDMAGSRKQRASADERVLLYNPRGLRAVLAESRGK
jgi:hypothetical protein